MASWEAFTAFGTIIGSALGFGVAHGKLRQKVNDMNKQIVINTGRLKDMEQQLNAGDSNFKVLDVKLDNLKEQMTEIKATIVRCFGDKP